MPFLPPLPPSGGRGRRWWAVDVSVLNQDSEMDSGPYRASCWHLRGKRTTGRRYVPFSSYFVTDPWVGGEGGGGVTLNPASGNVAMSTELGVNRHHIREISEPR